MKKNFLLTTLCLASVLVFSTAAQAQLLWLRDLKIRQSFDDDERKQNPALLSFTFPKDKPSSYLADIALSHPLGPLSNASGTSSTDLVAEYHRTNLADAEQNNLQIGAKNKWIFKKPVISPVILLAPAPLLDYATASLGTTIKYRRDKIEGSSGAAASFILSYFRQGSSYRLWFNSSRFFNNSRWDPLESTCRHASLSIL